MAERHTPGLAGYLIAWLFSAALLGLIWPFTVGAEAEDLGDAWQAVFVYGLLFSVPLAPPGIWLVHATCRHEPRQSVHVAVAGVAGVLAGCVAAIWPLAGQWAFPLALGLSTALARALVVPLVPARGEDFAVPPGAR